MEKIALVQAALRRKFGDQLTKVERWSVFRNGESTQEWVDFLGQTAIVLTHQELMVEITDKLLANDPTVSKNERLLLQLAFAFHDIGEITVGDTPAPDKTAQSNTKEFQAALASLRELSSELEENIPLEDIYLEIVAGQNAILHSLFCAIEKTEYLMTAITGYAHLMISNDSSANKWQLVARVLSFDLPKIIDLAKLYPHSIGAYLKSEQETLTEMMTAVLPHIRPEFQSAYDESRTRWVEFVSVII